MSAWPFSPLRPLGYGAILADPPWAYAMRSSKGYGKCPETHYATMTEAELAALPVGQLASGDCMLWMWSTWPHLPVALRVMQAWGFTYCTGGSWTKLTSTGKRAFGTGYVLRSATEPFLIGTIGEPAWVSRSVRNLIESERREHSRKPPEARRMIEALLPNAFACELFAREPWPGHAVWGLETGKFGLAQDAEALGDGRGGVAECDQFGLAPGGALGGDAIVDPERRDGQLRLFREQFPAGGLQGVAVDIDAAELRGDRKRPQRLQDGVPVGGRGRAGYSQAGENDGRTSHAPQPSGRER
jgi:N6-adenosine-specific RNA methylase IME4